MLDSDVARLEASAEFDSPLGGSMGAFAVKASGSQLGGGC